MITTKAKYQTKFNCHEIRGWIGPALSSLDRAIKVAKATQETQEQSAFTTQLVQIRNELDQMQKTVWDIS